MGPACQRCQCVNPLCFCVAVNYRTQPKQNYAKIKIIIRKNLNKPANFSLRLQILSSTFVGKPKIFREITLHMQEKKLVTDPRRNMQQKI